MKPRHRSEAGHQVAGLDVGTVNIVGATQNAAGRLECKSLRNAFLGTPASRLSKSILKRERVKFFEVDAKIYVLGDSAVDLANRMNRSVRRPMEGGMINPGETNAGVVLELFMQTVLGRAKEEGALCCYSVPADSIDSEFKVVYHSSIIGSVLKKLGYQPKALNEGAAVVFSELGHKNFTGIGMSCGGGLFNVCVCDRAHPVIQFSIGRGGDWVDGNSAKVLGLNESRMSMIKERGINLNAPKTREENAIVIYYKDLIRYVLKTISEKLVSARKILKFPGPVDLICGGGSSLVGGFVDAVQEEMRIMKFPVRIGEVKLAEDPLLVVSRGCYIAALATP